MSSPLRLAEYDLEHAPRLTRVPDGRKSPLPLFDPIFFGYLGLMLGAPAAAACALYNAVGVRRAGLAVEALALGALAWLGWIPVADAVRSAGLENVSLVVLVMRALALGLGAVLAYRQWAHVRGHRQQHGAVAPLLWCVLAGLGLALLLPAELRLMLMGVR